MIIRTLITLALAVPAFWLTMRFNMHMFQLNTYMNNEQSAWLAKNRHLQWILYFAIALGAVRMFVPLAGLDWLTTVTDVLVWITLIVIILVYRLLIEMNSKKPLKFTPRVKRMVATIIVVNVLIVLVCYAMVLIRNGRIEAWNLAPLGGFLLAMVGLQLGENMLANSINRPIEKGVNNHYINDAKRILKENPDLTIIGVTGSYGKTSMKYYLNTLLEDFYNVLITPGNFNTTLGVVRTIREHLKPSHEIFLCEMGARHVNDIKEICDLVHPDAGIITSIGPQHLETFYNMENIINTKYELADALPSGGRIFLNGDNEYILQNADKYRQDKQVIFYTNEKGEGYHAGDLKLSNLGTEFTVEAPDGESARFAMRLIGGHNVINVCGAIAVAHEMGIPLEKLRVPVRRIEPVEHRLQMIQKGNVTIIDDAYNSNPVGSKAAVETLHMFEGLRILVTPGMVELGDKEEEYNYKFGTYAAANCDYIALVGRRSHTDPIRNGALDSGFPEKKLRSFDDLKGALEWAYGRTEEGHKYILLENDLPDNY